MQLFNFQVWEDMEEKRRKLCLRKRWINCCKLYLELSHLYNWGYITKIFLKSLYSSYLYWNYSAEIQIIIFTWISREPKLHVKFVWISREIHVKKFTWISLLLLNSRENFHVKFTWISREIHMLRFCLCRNMLDSKNSQIRIEQVMSYYTRWYFAAYDELYTNCITV